MKQRIAFAMIMGVVTTGIISFTLISINIGFVANFFSDLAEILERGIYDRHSGDFTHRA